jgi:hypothetical protein
MKWISNGKTWEFGRTNLLLREIIRKVCNHDLVLGWNSVSRGTTLTSLTWSTVGSSLSVLGLLGLLGLGCGLVGFGQGEDLRSSWEFCTLLTAGLLTN